MNHTPGPLQIKRESDNQGYKGIVLMTPGGSCIANMVMQLDDTELANAKFIIQACNAHEELVKSLKEMTTILSAIQNTLTGYLTPDSTLDQDDCINAILNISDHKETLSKQRSALQLLTTIEKGA